ncbi:hypothetical protein ACFL31_00040 [Candidatus Margulisiibacteriota bacterium]
MPNIPGIAELHVVEEQDRRDDVGSAEPTYIPNEDEPITGEAEPVDSAGINGSTNSPGPVHPAPPPPRDITDDNYLDNSDEYNTAVAPSAGAEVFRAAAEGLDAADQRIMDLFEELNNAENFISGSQDDYQDIYGDKLAEIMLLMSLLTYYELEIEMLMEAKIENDSKFREIVLQLQREADEVGRSAFLNSAKKKMQIAQEFIVSLYKSVYTHNTEIYNQRIKQYEKEREEASGWEEFCNWFTGDLEIELERKKRDETIRLNQALGKNLAALRQAFKPMIEVFANSESPELRGLGAALRAFDNKLAEACQILNQPITHETDYFDKESLQNMFQDILREIRVRLVAVENTYRAYVFLGTAKEDIGASLRETVFEISSHSSKSEYVYAAYEGFSKLTNLFFDTTFNTLMMRTRFYNEAIRLAKNVKKLEKARGWRIFGRILTVVAIVIIVIVAIATIYFSGGTATPAWVSILGLVGAGTGIAGGAATAAGVAIADSVVDDCFDVSQPEDYTFDLIANPRKTNYSVADAISEAERQEELLVQQLSQRQLIQKRKDGFYQLNPKALAAFEIRLRTLQNIAKFITYFDKGKRDINRTIRAIILEKAVKDHGEGYLLLNVENSLHHRQLYTQAIKHKLQEVVTARNIERQNDLMVKNAIWAGFAPVIGAFCGVWLALIPGIGVGLALGVGAALGGAIHGLIDVYSADSALGMDFELKSEEFDRYLKERKQNRESSGTPEDKLYELEDRIYQRLLSEGLVDIGNGYVGLNPVMVGQANYLLMKIQMLRELLNSLRNGRIKIDAGIRRQVLGVGGAYTDFGKIVTKGAFLQSMTIIQALTNFLSEKAEVLNRVKDAEEALTMAWVNFGISAGFSVVGGGIAGAGSSLGISKTICQIANNVTPGLMGLSNSIVGIARGVSDAQDDFGYFEDFDEEKAVKQIRGDKVKGEEGEEGEEEDLLADIYEDVDELERQIYLEAGRNLITALAGPNVTVNGELTGILSDRMFTLNEIKQLIHLLLSTRWGISRKAGLVTAYLGDLSDLVNMQEQLVENILNQLTQVMDIIVQRQNQISRAERGVIIGSISAALSVVSTVLSCVAVSKSVEAGKNIAEYEDVQEMSTGEASGVDSIGTKGEAAPQGEAVEAEIAVSEKTEAPQNDEAEKPVPAPTQEASTAEAPAPAPTPAQEVSTAEAPAPAPEASIAKATVPAPEAPTAGALAPAPAQAQTQSPAPPISATAPALPPGAPTAEAPASVPTPSPEASAAKAPAPEASTAKTPTPTPASKPAPSPAATHAATQAATQTPTQTPIQIPTQTPTQAPIQAPTQTPTQTPTQIPTQTPTQAPTPAQTPAPADKTSVNPGQKAGSEQVGENTGAKTGKKTVETSTQAASDKADTSDGKKTGISAKEKQKRLRRLSEKITELKTDQGVYTAISTSLVLLSTIATYATGKIYDNAKEQENKSKETGIKSSGLDSSKNKNGKTSGASSGKAEQALVSDNSSSVANLYSTMQGLELSARQSDIMISAYSTPSAVDLILQQANEWMSTLFAGIKEAFGLSADISSAVSSKKGWYPKLDPKLLSAAPVMTEKEVEQAAQMFTRQLMESKEPKKLIFKLLQEAQKSESAKANAEKVLTALLPQLEADPQRQALVKRAREILRKSNNNVAIDWRNGEPKELAAQILASTSVDPASIISAFPQIVQRGHLSAEKALSTLSELQALPDINAETKAVIIIAAVEIIKSLPAKVESATAGEVEKALAILANVKVVSPRVKTAVAVAVREIAAAAPKRVDFKENSAEIAKQILSLKEPEQVIKALPELVYNGMVSRGKAKQILKKISDTKSEPAESLKPLMKKVWKAIERIQSPQRARVESKPNQSDAPVKVPPLPDPEIASLPAQVKKNEVSVARALEIVVHFEQHLKQQPVAAAGLRPQTPAKRTQAFKPAQQNSNSSSRGMNNIKRAETIIRSITDVQQQARVLKQQAEGLKVRTEGTQKAQTPQEQLKALEVLKVRLEQALRVQERALKQLTEDLPKLEKQNKEIMKVVKARLGEIEGLLKQPERLTAKLQKALLVEKELLEQVEGSLKKEIESLKATVKNVKQKIASIKQQLKDVRTEIVRAKESAAKETPTADSGKDIDAREAIQKISSLGSDYKRRHGKQTYEEIAQTGDDVLDKLQNNDDRKIGVSC